MDIIATLEKEEIARLGKTIPAFAPGDTVIVNVSVVEGERKRVQAYEGVVIAKAQSRAQFVVRRAQDLERRRRRAHVPDVLAADRGHRGQAPRRRAPRQALLPARSLRQVGADSRKARARAQGKEGRVNRVAARATEGSREAAFSTAAGTHFGPFATRSCRPLPLRNGGHQWAEWHGSCCSFTCLGVEFPRIFPQQGRVIHRHPDSMRASLYEALGNRPNRLRRGGSRRVAAPDPQVLREDPRWTGQRRRGAALHQSCQPHPERSGPAHPLQRRTRAIRRQGADARHVQSATDGIAAAGGTDVAPDGSADDSAPRRAALAAQPGRRGRPARGPSTIPGSPSRSRRSAGRRS